MSTCPFGGFLIESSSGDQGNFEVVIPWPAGGLAHFWRNNDADGFPWIGPTLFGEKASYISAALTESDYHSDATDKPGHFEVLAMRAGGTIDQYWRESGGGWSWFGPFAFEGRCVGNPSLTQAGHFEQTQWDDHANFFALLPQPAGGFETWRRNNPTGRPSNWERTETLVGQPLSGAGMILSPVHSLSSSLSYDGSLGSIGDLVVAAVAGDGTLAIYAKRPLSTVLDDPRNGAYQFHGPFTFGRELLPNQIHQRFRGRPSIIGTSYEYHYNKFPFTSRNYGNYDMIAPVLERGICHFWKENGYIGDAEQAPDMGWRGGQTFGAGIYDQVSMIQSNLGDRDDGHLEVVAYSAGEPGFDFYWRDDDLTTWHGPTHVE